METEPPLPSDRETESMLHYPPPLGMSRAQWGAELLPERSGVTQPSAYPVLGISRASRGAEVTPPVRCNEIELVGALLSTGRCEQG